MRNYLAVPILLGAAVALLYGVMGVVIGIFDAFGWVDEVRFHIVGVHFEGFALVVVSFVLILIAFGAMRYLTRAKERPA